VCPRKKSSTFGPSLLGSRGDPVRRLTARVPPCSRPVQRNEARIAPRFPRPSPAEGPRRSRQCRSGPAGAASASTTGVCGRARGAGPGPGGTWFAAGRGPAAGAQRRWGWPSCCSTICSARKYEVSSDRPMELFRRGRPTPRALPDWATRWAEGAVATESAACGIFRRGGTSPEAERGRSLRTFGRKSDVRCPMFEMLQTEEGVF